MKTKTTFVSLKHNQFFYTRITKASGDIMDFRSSAKPTARQVRQWKKIASNW